jgi:effector-binding domain-containing protein
MPLEAIQALLQAPTPAALQARLYEHQERIAARIEQDRQSLRLIQQLIDHQEDDLACSVQIKTLPNQLIAGIRVQVSPEDESRLIPALIDELEVYTTKLGIRCHGSPPLRISHEYSEERVDSEIGVPITGPINSQQPDHITATLLPGGPAASVMHIGPHADLWTVYWAILVWMQDQGYEQDGPPRELYWVPPTAGHSAQYRTEIQWPFNEGRTNHD